MGEDGREGASDAREKRCGDRIRIGWERIGREGKKLLGACGACAAIAGVTMRVCVRVRASMSVKMHGSILDFYCRKSS